MTSSGARVDGVLPHTPHIEPSGSDLQRHRAGVSMSDVTVLGPVLVRLVEPEIAWSDWASSPVVELPAFRLDDIDYAFHTGRRIENGRVRQSLGPDDDEDAMLRRLGGEILDVYRVLRLGDAEEPGGPRLATGLFRMPLPRPESGRTVPPLLQAMAFVIDLPPGERTGFIDRDYTATIVIEVKPGITITTSDTASAIAAARELGYDLVPPPTPGVETILPTSESGRKRRSLFRR